MELLELYENSDNKNTVFKNFITFISRICTSSFAGNIIVYTPSQGTNWEKYFDYIIYKSKNTNSGGK